jgi:transcriptional regulator with XRE-family HTH domain
MIAVSLKKDVPDPFREALRKILSQHSHGIQSQLALSVDLSPQYLGRILNGQRHGTEKTRRAIAAALGYPGPLYEDFLRLGRNRPKPDPPARAEEADPADSRLTPEQRETVTAFKLVLLRGGRKAEALTAVVAALADEK